MSAGISALCHGHHGRYQLRVISPVNYISLLDNISLSDADVFLQKFNDILALYVFPMKPVYLSLMLFNCLPLFYIDGLSMSCFIDHLSACERVPRLLGSWGFQNIVHTSG